MTIVLNALSIIYPIFSVVNKCSLHVPNLFDGERNQPRNVHPVFGGAPPANDTIAWHGQPNYNYLIPPSTDATVLLSKS